MFCEEECCWRTRLNNHRPPKMVEKVTVYQKTTCFLANGKTITFALVDDIDHFDRFTVVDCATGDAIIENLQYMDVESFKSFAEFVAQFTKAAQIIKSKPRASVLAEKGFLYKAENK